MKKLKILIVLATFSLFWISCQNENELDSMKTREITFSPEEIRLLSEIANNTPKVSEEEAMNRALGAVNSLFTFTKSGKARTIKNSNALTTPKVVSTKSLEEESASDTVAYIFNFEGDEGFAIVAADERVPEQIIACMESGNFDLGADNPGLAIFLERVEDYIVQSIEKAEAYRDSLAQEIFLKLVAENPELADTTTKIAKPNDTPLPSSSDSDPLAGTYTEVLNSRTFEWTTVSSVAPLTVVEWNQTDPYNRFTRVKGRNGDAPYTGCVAVATAQIMAYWKYPSSIDGYAMNWTEMCRYTSDIFRNHMFNNQWVGSVTDLNAPTTAVDNIARLMERIGAHVGMKYESDGSDADSDNAIKWLKQIGFSGGEKSNYNFNLIKSSLNAKRIVYGRGYSSILKKKFLGLTLYTEKRGHAWNYDGYICQSQRTDRTIVVIDRKTNKVLTSTSSTIYNYQDMVHVNWGWGGDYNGYYMSEVFNTNNPAISSLTRSNDAGQTGLYQYDLEIYTNLRR